MAKRIDLTGQKFGRLTVIEFAGVSPLRRIRWHCKCDCGGTTISESGNLRNGISRSCGCYRLERTHEAKYVHGRNQKDPTYGSWYSLRQRCNNPNHPKYQHYGGRGIKHCERWNDFLLFLEDMGERPLGKTLDRIDVDGNYEPSNCRWATAKEQRNNQRKKPNGIGK